MPTRAAARPCRGPGAPQAAFASHVVFDRDTLASYVLSRRSTGGGYCFYRTPAWGVEEPNAPDTLAALESLRLLGIDPPHPEATGRYLRSVQRDDGGFPTLVIGWAALRGLELLDLHPNRPPGPWLQGLWTALLGHSPDRNVVRLWPAALRDALRLVEVLPPPATAAEGQRAGLAELLDAAGDPAGGWARPAADLETTGVACRLLSLSGLPGAGLGGVAELFRRCEDPVLGLRIVPGAAANSAGALWGGLVAAGALDLRLRYPAAISQGLVLLQRPDGGLGARHQAISTLRDTWRGLEAAALFDQLQEDLP
jgi:hypothetical protein